MKALHVTSVAFSLGGLLSMLILLGLKQQLNPGENLFLIDLSIFKVFNHVVNYSFYGVLVTGLAFSLFTRWGFFKHRWIAVKWATVLLLFTFTWVWIGPAISGNVALSDGGLSVPGAQDDYLGYTRKSQLYALIEGLLFVALIFISVLKPWGMRRRHFAVSRKAVLGATGALAVILAVFLVMNAVSLQKYRGMEIADSDLSSLVDGTYYGTATCAGFTYEAETRVVGHAIADVKITTTRKSLYARFAAGVIPRVLAAQNANVDAITGATTTSKCLLKTIEDALMGRRRVE